jgi:hypothetical protein
MEKSCEPWPPGLWNLINMINPMFSLLQIHSLNHQISRRWPYFPALRELQEVLEQVDHDLPRLNPSKKSPGKQARYILCDPNLSKCVFILCNQLLAT